MRCSKCRSHETKVLESRSIHEGDLVRRRRSCLKCEYRFTTYEQEERFRLRVEKKDGRFEDFSQDKIIKSISIACQKRPVKPEQIEQLVNNLKLELQTKNVRSIKSHKIGDILIDKIRELDHVAYVRFASVYKEFKDPDEFFRELKALKNKDT